MVVRGVVVVDGDLGVIATVVDGRVQVHGADNVNDDDDDDDDET